jgi:hypothetical protein
MELGDELNGDNEDGKLSKNVDGGEASTTDKNFKPLGVTAPSDYCFHGYFAFACFGLTRGVYFLDFLNPKGNLEEQLKDEKQTSPVIQ